MIFLPRDTDLQKQKIISSTVADIMSAVYDKLTLNNDESELSSVNRIAHTVRLPVSRSTFNLLQLTQEYNLLTKGAFDVTVAPLAYLWGFYGGNTPRREISPEVLLAARQGVGYERIKLFKNAVELTSPYTRVNLDAIASAYAIDLAILKLRRHHYTDVLIRMDGFARCLGNNTGDRPWLYPLLNPLNNQPLGTLILDYLKAAATVQTGDNYITIAGKQYSHIIDPRNGQPVNNIAAVTVLAPTATEAAALANALFVLGVQKGREILSSFPRCEAMIIPSGEPCTLFITRGMAESFVSVEGQSVACEIIDPKRGLL